MLFLELLNVFKNGIFIFDVSFMMQIQSKIYSELYFWRDPDGGTKDKTTV